MSGRYSPVSIENKATWLPKLRKWSFVIFGVFCVLTYATLLLWQAAPIKPISMALFLQIGNINKIDDLLTCVGNVVEA